MNPSGRRLLLLILDDNVINSLLHKRVATLRSASEARRSNAGACALGVVDPTLVPYDGSKSRYLRESHLMCTGGKMV